MPTLEKQSFRSANLIALNNATVLEAALMYASQGIKIFPVKARGKNPLTTHGLKDATDDLEVIKAWWKKWPDANIGLATGSVNNLWVFDVDKKNNGYDSLDKLIKEHGAIQSSLVCITGGGGRHYFFRYSDVVISSRNGILPGIDIKAEGGYVVVVPSLHESDSNYQWELSIQDQPCASLDPAPDWIIKLVTSKMNKKKQGPDVINNTIIQGMRNASLFKATCHVLKIFHPQLAHTMITSLNSKHCSPPLHESEIASIITSATKYSKSSKQRLQSPELAQEALIGIPTSVVDVFGPHTEADGVAIIAQMMAVIGTYANNLYYAINGTNHSPNMFVLIVGDSSKSRKGTSWGIAEALLAPQIRHFMKNNFASGLSSGEGVIYRVRDASINLVKGKEENDPGVSDKRLVIVESEFGNCLHVIKRDGNTLSPLMRNAWDRKQLEILTKNSPIKATSPHISLVAHITMPELTSLLASREIFNGFGNRICFFYAKRSRILPIPTALEDIDTSSLSSELRQVFDFIDSFKTLTRMNFSAEAVNVWKDKYPELSRSHDGNFGSMVARSEAHVIRLSMIYAIMDRSVIIEAKHLSAALALWQYCEDTCFYIFGENQKGGASSHAEKVLSYLKGKSSNTCTRTEILKSCFHKNLPTDRIDEIKNELLEANLITIDSGQGAEIWELVQDSPSHNDHDVLSVDNSSCDNNEQL